ncbi:MAG: glycosyltransferase family 4 protein [Actinomycetota bacterium]|nr:glycosyltransferase family 4 protein [Actinomycetota bacterium]
MYLYSMRVCLWHGWLLEGSGSNVYTAKITEILRRQGHDVLLICQQPDPERFDFIDAAGTVDANGVSELKPTGAPPAAGQAVFLRPEIGPLLPVFVDEYSELEVKRFPDLSEEELGSYLARNVDALRAAVDWHGAEATIVGHAVAGPAIAYRALGAGRYVAKLHGSDLEYAVRLQDRYRELAAEGLEPATAVVGTSDDVIARAIALIPGIGDHVVKIAPGVEVDRFRPMPRREALTQLAERLREDPETERGRPDDLDSAVAEALRGHDAAALDALSHRYDQTTPDPATGERMMALRGFEGPLVGYFGKLILQKGVERLIEAVARLPLEVRGTVVGFGRFREWLQALVLAIDGRDTDTLRWLADASGMELEIEVLPSKSVGLADRMTFTGLLDHRYAPLALAALDVQVVPSTLAEAFGMVAAEGASAGALPVVARHSGLAEVATALESAIARPGLLSFEPGPGATVRLVAAIERILAIRAEERMEMRAAVSAFVAREWTWERTAERLLATVGGGS